MATTKSKRSRSLKEGIKGTFDGSFSSTEFQDSVGQQGLLPVHDLLVAILFEHLSGRASLRSLKK